MTRVTVQHLRTVQGFGPRPGLCAPGARAWCARYGVSWADFVREGIDADVLLATGDAFAIALVAHAQGEKHGQR